MRVEHIGDAVLYCGDCLEVLPTLGRVDAVVTDPPYGIGYSPAGGGGGITDRNGKRYEKRFTGNDLVRGDNKPFDPTPFLQIAPITVMWGGNHFADKLPASSCWLVWDKRCGTSNNDFADCEIAWTNMPRVARVFNHLWNGMLKDSERGIPRVHPTQKPIEVMRWCLEQVKAEIILDPFMGSGTTGVACANLGRIFIGIEIEPKYYEIALKRITEAYRQPRLFQEPVAKAVQTGFDL